MDKIDAKTFADCMRSILKARGMAVIDLAAGGEVSKTQVQSAARGTAGPRVQAKIAEKLGFSSVKDLVLEAALGHIIPPSTGLRIPTDAELADTVPVFDSVAAGWDGDIHDPQDVGADNGISNKRWPRWGIGTDDPQAFGVIVHGDSMAPEYPHGAIVFCSPAAAQKGGDDCVMRLDDGSAFLRRIFEVPGAADMLTLHPLNAKYKPKTVAREAILSMSKVIKTLK